MVGVRGAGTQAKPGSESKDIRGPDTVVQGLVSLQIRDLRPGSVCVYVCVCVCVCSHMRAHTGEGLSLERKRGEREGEENDKTMRR